MAKDILTHIQENMSSFSKGQKLIANFILESYDKAAFMTACKLGKTVNVSESTVVRFAAELGYDGYPSMQKALQEMIRNKLTSIQRIEVSNDRIGNQDIMSMVMQSDIEKIRITLEETALKRQAQGADIAIVYPEEGTSAVPDGSALIAGAPHPDNARAFLDFAQSRDVQELVVSQFSRRSVRTDVSDGDALPPADELALIDYPVRWAAELKDAFSARWPELLREDAPS